MQKTRRLAAAVLAALPIVAATVAGPEGEGPRITVYNQDFALVRQVRRLHLKEGDNELRIGGLTALLEPESVVLRDLQDARGLRILEQRYAGDTLSQGFLLRQHEGKVLAFQTVNPATGRKEVVSGRVIRSGYAPQGSAATGGTTPIIEVDGKIQFSLPGEPLFDGPGPDALLEPLLRWNLWSDRAGERDVELSFITGGLGWQATYNAVTSEKSARFDLVGWISLTNNSGGEFKDARVKLMAGEVNRTQPVQARALMLESAVAEAPPRPPQVTEKAFDEYHLYTLPRPVNLLNGESLQVEFCRSSDLPAERLYVYDGSQMNVYTGWGPEMARTRPDFGTESNTRVASMLEFTNGKASGLGIPLPRGTMKVYRADADGTREFIGESALGHTAADEKVRLYLGDAFDLVGERRQTNYRIDATKESAEESFEIRVRNHKSEPVDVRVVEHLYRWSTWKIVDSSDPYEKTDAKTIEFRVKVPSGGEKLVAYHARYSW